MYAGVGVSELLGNWYPPLMIPYPNKFYPNYLDTKDSLIIQTDMFGYRVSETLGVKKLSKN